MFQQSMAISREGESAERNRNPEVLYEMGSKVAKSTYSGSAQYFPNSTQATGKRFPDLDGDAVFYPQNPGLGEHPKAICRVISYYSHSQKLRLQNAFRLFKMMDTGKYVSAEGTPESFSAKAHVNFFKKMLTYNNVISETREKKLFLSDIEFNFFVLGPLQRIVLSDHPSKQGKTKSYFLILLDLLLLENSDGITHNFQKEFIFKPGATFSPGLLIQFTSIVLKCVLDVKLFPFSDRTKIDYDEPLGKVTTLVKNLLGDCPHNKERKNLREPIFTNALSGTRIFLRMCTLIKNFRKLWADFKAGNGLIPCTNFVQYMHGEPMNKILLMLSPRDNIVLEQFLPGVVDFFKKKLNKKDTDALVFVQQVRRGRKRKLILKFKVFFFIRTVTCFTQFK